MLPFQESRFLDWKIYLKPIKFLFSFGHDSSVSDPATAQIPVVQLKRPQVTEKTKYVQVLHIKVLRTKVLLKAHFWVNWHCSFSHLDFRQRLAKFTVTNPLILTPFREWLSTARKSSLNVVKFWQTSRGMSKQESNVEAVTEFAPEENFADYILEEVCHRAASLQSEIPCVHWIQCQRIPFWV